MIWRQFAQTHPELLTDADSKGLTPLHEAAMSGNIETIGYLLLDAYMSVRETSPHIIVPLKDLIDSYQRNLLHSLFESKWTQPSFDKLQIVVSTLLNEGVDRFAKDSRHRTPLKSLILKSVVVVSESAKKTFSATPIKSTFKFSIKGIPLLKLGKKESDFKEIPGTSESSLPTENTNIAQKSHPENSDLASDPNEMSNNEESVLDENPIAIAETLLDGLDPKETDRNIMLMFKNDIGSEWQEDWRPVQQAMQIAEYFPFLPIFASRCSVESLSCILANGRSIWHYLANMGAQSSVLEAYAAHFADKGTPRAAFESETGISVPYAAPHVLYIRTMVNRTFEALMNRPDAERLKNLQIFDVNHQSPLHSAATYNNVTALRKMYETFGEESQSWSDSEGKTPLHYSVQFDTILTLLEIRALEWSLNPVDAKGRTPYALALELRRTKAAQLLRAWGASLGDNTSSVSELNFDLNESSADAPDVPASPRIDGPVAAGEGATKRLSLSLSSLPAFNEADNQPLTVRVDETVPEEDENELEEDEEVAEDSLAGAASAAQNRSTAALVSAITRAKVRDQEAEEEAMQLKSELERLKEKLAAKEGEMLELEKALDSRPSIQEFTETQARNAKLSQSNETLTNTVRSLRQHVADLGLKINDEQIQRSRSSSTCTPPASPIRESEYKQSLYDYEKHIEQLHIQLQEARNSAAEMAANSKRQSDDLLAQFRRQLDNTQADLAKEEMLRLEAEEKLSEKEEILKNLRVEHDALVTSPAKEVQLDTFKEELNVITEELRRRNAQVEEYRESMKDSETRIASLKDEIFDLKSKMADQKEVVIEGDLKMTESELALAQAEIQALRAQLDAAVIASNATESEKNQWLKRIETVEMDHDRLQRENVELRSEAESHKRSNETMNKAVETLESAMLHLKEADNIQKERLERLEQDLEDAIRERNEYRETHTSRSQLAINQAKKQMEGLEKALLEIQERLERDEVLQRETNKSQLSDESLKISDLQNELKEIKALFMEKKESLESALETTIEERSATEKAIMGQFEDLRQLIKESQATNEALLLKSAESGEGKEVSASTESNVSQELQQLSIRTEDKLTALQATIDAFISSNATENLDKRDESEMNNLLNSLAESERKYANLLESTAKIAQERASEEKRLLEERMVVERKLQAELLALTSARASDEEKLLSATKNFESRISSLLMEHQPSPAVASSPDDLHLILDKLSSADVERAQLLSKVNQLSEALESERIGRSETQLSSVPDSSDSELQSLKSQLAEAQSNQNELRHQMALLESQLTSKNDELATATKTLEALLLSSKKEDLNTTDQSEKLVMELETLKKALEEERLAKEHQLLRDAEIRASLERAAGEAKASSISLSAQLEQLRKTLAEKSAALETAKEHSANTNSSLMELKSELRHAQAETDRLKALDVSGKGAEMDVSSELKELREQSSSILAHIASLTSSSPTSKVNSDSSVVSEVKIALNDASVEMKKTHEALLHRVATTSKPPATPSQVIPRSLYAVLGVISFVVLAILLQVLTLNQAEFDTHYS